MNVISVFNGISCGRVALERANVPVERYVSFEIDKYANQVAKENYPNDEYNGDVFQADFTQYKGFDLLIGGSPCTHWSIAKQGRETTSSGIGWELFMQYKRALIESDCRYFLYENNYSIHKDIQSAISEELDVQPIMINSALVSAQQRKRLYWTNIPNVEQPKYKSILLKDILESGVAYSEKSYPLKASCGGGMGAKTGLYKIDLPDGDYIIRKLTPIECERLQTLPDNYTAAVSNTQRYKGLGNGWTVNVIAHILKNIPR